jgi:dimethylglycine dehydrogenase
MIVDGEEAPAQPGDSVMRDGRVVGTVTSAGWGFRVNRNLAMAFVTPEHAAIGTELRIEIVGRTFRATVCEECLYDPSNDRIFA